MNRKFTLGLAAAVALGAVATVSLKEEIALKAAKEAAALGEAAPALQGPLREVNKPVPAPARVAPDNGYELPITFDGSYIDECQVFDLNDDNSTWKQGTKNERNAFKYNYSSSNAADDWCILPAIDCTAQALKFKIEYSAESGTFAEAFKVVIADEPTVEAMQNGTVVLDKPEVNSTAINADEVTVEGLTPGKKYVALYCCSAQNMYYLWVYSIGIEIVDDNAPVAPTVEVTTDDLEASVKINVPSTTIGGGALDDSEPLDLAILIDGVQKESFQALPGKVVTKTVSVEAYGPHKVSVTCKKGNLPSNPFETTVTFLRNLPDPIPMGYTFIPDLSQWLSCTTVDVAGSDDWFYDTEYFLNHDEVEGGSFAINSTWSSAKCDDWLIFPKMNGPAGAKMLTFDLWTQWNEHELEFYVAKEATVEAFTAAGKIETASSKYISESKWTTFEEEFLLAEGGDFYFAIRCLSNTANRMSIRNVSIKNVAGTSPVAATWGEASFNGGNGCVPLNLPSINKSGEQMGADVTVYADITLDGEAYGEAVSGAPGETVNVSFTDLAMGEHTASATVYIMEDGEKVGDRVCTTAFNIYRSTDFCYTLPADFGMGKDYFDDYIVVDANGDGKTFTAETSYFKYTYHSTNAADDWMITRYPVKVTDVNALYEITVNMSSHSDSYKETFEIFIGKEANVESMTIPVIPATTVPGTEALYTGIFSLPEAGDYYIGVHCVSAKNLYYLFFKSMTMKVSDVSPNSPAAPEDFVADGADSGENLADVSFTFPTKNYLGGDLDADKDLTAVITTPAGSKEVKGKPGEAVTTTADAIELAQTLSLVVKNEYGSSPELTASIKCGKGRPSTPGKVNVKVDEDGMGLVLSWEPITTTVEAGLHANSAGMRYEISKEVLLEDGGVTYNDWEIIATVTEPEYHFTAEDGAPQTMVNLAVNGRNGEEDKYIGGRTMASGVVGTTHELPMNETFADGEMHYAGFCYTSTSSSYYAPTWNVVPAEDAMEYVESPSGTHVLYGVYNSQYGCNSEIRIPRFSTEGEGSVTVSFTHYMGIEDPTKEIYLYRRDMEGISTEPFMTIAKTTADDFKDADGEPLTDESGAPITAMWKTETFTLPEAFNGQPWVDMRINHLWGYNSAAQKARMLYDNFEVKKTPGTMIENVDAEAIANDAPVEYFNLQGMRIAAPALGQVYLERRGTAVAKRLAR